MKKLIFTLVILSALSLFSFADANSDMDKAQSEWIAAVNSKSPDLKKSYFKGAVFFDTENITEGSDSISSLILGQNNLFLKPISGFTTIARYKTADTAKYLELGYYTTEDSQKLGYAVTWEKAGKFYRKNLDVIYPLTTGDNGFTEISDSLLLKWCDLATKKGSEYLVSTLYTETPYYFNGSTLYRGKKALSEVWSDMGTSSYKISLASKNILPLDSKTAFILGEYTYGFDNQKGKFFLIWKKNDAGEWKIAIDSD